MFTAILTDFGTKDAYTAILKQIIFSKCPETEIIDITHEIEPQNVISAAYVLYTAFTSFPGNTVFLCIVDPGVGSERRELLTFSLGKLIISPDNGIISLVRRMHPASEFFRCKDDIVKDLNKIKPSFSRTFDGRDLFAPIAGMAGNNDWNKLRGEDVSPVTVSGVMPAVSNTNNSLSAIILHTDRFGNCVTSIHISEWESPGEYPCTVSMNNEREIKFSEISGCYTDVPKGEELLYWGSFGFLEIGINQGNAAETFHLKSGDFIKIRSRDMLS